MPQLPGKPAAPSGWAKGQAPTQASDKMQRVSAAVVMQHFARSEVRSIDKVSDAFYAAMVMKLRTMREFARFKDGQLREVIKNITYKLQTAELTINFKAASYFSAPNDWRTYRQMYDMALQDVKQADGGTKREMRLTGNALNPATTRDAADTKVTFGANIKTPQMQGAARFMQTGGLKDVSNGAAGGPVYTANNAHFNPRARQLFAGLNYGRRPHGSSTQYGLSHFVLQDGFKTNAIYYAGDTFYVTDANARVTYGMLFALVLHASDNLTKAILDSCYRQTSLKDTSNGDELVEAHIFDEIQFAKDIKEMRVSNNDIINETGSLMLSGKVSMEDLPKLREDIKKNARDFASRNNIKLVWMD